MLDIETFLRTSETDSENKHYIVGAFESGVTVYKQQMRATNLIYALHKKKIIEVKEDKPLAIIGGGIAGLTASVAAIALGYKVYLFEKKTVLCHLQRGCETRWLHPHIYDWPLPGSESPYAALPFLTWKAGSAANVVDQIMSEFRKVNKTNIGKNNLHVIRKAKLSVEGKHISYEGVKSVDSSSGDDWESEGFEACAVVFCVGYGVEKLVERKWTTSYWRNDSVSQPVIHPGPNEEEVTFLVSGTGDGGLIDVLRLRIKNFNQGKLLEDFFPDDNDKIKHKLIEIIQEWNLAESKNQQLEPNWLHRKFSALRDAEDLRESFDKILGKITRRLRKDTEVTLNGENKRDEIFGLNRASLLNSFLVYLLLRFDKRLKYLQGKCDTSSPSPRKVKTKSYEQGKTKQVSPKKTNKTQPAEISLKINNKTMKFHNYIFRHGTDRNSILKKAGCSKGAKLLNAGDPIRGQIETSPRLWEVGWWEDNANTESVNEGIVARAPTEFVPPAMVTIATTFVTTISDIIKPLTDKPFRLTLHRFIDIKGDEFFQQIARYAGTRENPNNWAVGRTWPANLGIAGLSGRLGKSVIINRDAKFEEIWEKLKITPSKSAPRPIDSDVMVLLACPFYSPVSEEDGITRVSLILFMDSNEEKLFDKTAVTQTIVSACEGFVRNLESMRKFHEVQFISSHYRGFPVKRSNEDENILSTYAAIDVNNDIFSNVKERLSFETIDSFDAKLRD